VLNGWLVDRKGARMDRLTEMTCFVPSVETGSFAAAGKELLMSAQLVGKQVASLESRLGVQLLVRERAARERHDFLANFGSPDFEHRALGTWRPSAGRRRNYAQIGGFHILEFYFDTSNARSK